MINQMRYIWQLLMITSLLTVVGILIITLIPIDLSIKSYLITLLAFAAINMAAWQLINMGIRKSNREGIVIILAGIGTKFLLYLLYILVFWGITKNLTKPFIITFFALYLAFTFLLANNLLNLLKNK